MAADEFRSRVDDDIGTVFERTQLIRRRERAVNDKRDLMLMSDVSDSLDVDEVGIRIADGLNVNDACILLDSLFEDLDALRRVDERRLNAVIRERMLKEVVRAAIDGRGGNDVLSLVNESLERIRDSRSTRCHSDSCHAALQSRDALGEYVFRRIRQAAVDIAGILECKTIRGMLSIVEYERRGLVNRYSACIRSRIGLLLTNMQLQRFKMVLSLFTHE